jgi:phosphoserine phosphatase
VVEGVFTGKILNYIGAEQKIACLQDFCKNNNIKPEECIAVGDGSTDIPIFEYCGNSIAINSSQKVRKSAMYAVDTDDLTDILEYIV